MREAIDLEVMTMEEEDGRGGVGWQRLSVVVVGDSREMADGDDRRCTTSAGRRCVAGGERSSPVWELIDVAGSAVSAIADSMDECCFPRAIANVVVGRFGGGAGDARFGEGWVPVGSLERARRGAALAEKSEDEGEPTMMNEEGPPLKSNMEKSWNNLSEIQEVDDHDKGDDD